ncbi:pyrimidine pathway regulatory protein 1 [Rhypophila sp. PSN 637]
MQAEQAPTPGVSSRRSACDRCRGQKLRCLRENADPEGRCDRCSKADVAQCITSPVYHMRNYSVATASDYPALPSPSHKRRRPADRPDDARGTGRPMPQQQNQDQSPTRATPPSAAPEATSTPFEWPSIDTLVPTSASDASSSNFGSINWNSLLDPLPQQPSGSASGSQAQGLLWSTYNEDTLRHPSLGNMGNIDLGLPNGSSAASSVPPNYATQSH